jgi:2'-5' RNA ligase
MVPASGLEELAGAVVAATAGIGQPPDDRPFHGHVTLGRLRRRGVRCALVGAPFTAEMHVTEVVLVESETGPDGSTYRAVARWPTTRSLP